MYHHSLLSPLPYTTTICILRWIPNAVRPLLLKNIQFLTNRHPKVSDGNHVKFLYQLSFLKNENVFTC